MSRLKHIYLAEIGDSPKAFKFESLEALGGVSSDLHLTHFNMDLTIQYAGEGYYINAHIQSQQKLPCTMCTGDSEFHQNLVLEEFLRVDPQFDADSDEIAKSDDSQSLVIKTPVWNILEFIKETLILEEPAQLYCQKEKCKNYDTLVSQGLLGTEQKKKEENSAFSSLKDIQF